MRETDTPEKHTHLDVSHAAPLGTGFAFQRNVWTAFGKGRVSTKTTATAEEGERSTYLTGEGDDSRSRRLSIFRGCPWGSDGLSGGRKVTDTAEDFRCPEEEKPLSFDECRELSLWNSSEIDVKVVVLDTVASGGDAPLSLRPPLRPYLVVK
jgi:hypothetical protein